ncbi:periplasmic beta-glucosidase-like [Littorina saxatilis]|uniref:periplasmic beta-glucosidase-like n=1 Tax=Littorina saxatilis TaxID=31220 RepID=UPI0038B42D30
MSESLTVTPVEGLGKLASTVTWANGCSNLPCQSYNASQVNGGFPWKERALIVLTLNYLENKGNGAPVVLLLFNGGPLNVTWADQNPSVSAIMECWFSAQSSGTALLHVLTNEGGTSSPAGRLPSTWPLLADDIPDFSNYSMSGRTYRYSNASALYPFGFGLSYTTFRYSDLVVPKTLTLGRDLDVTVTVTNTGSVPADEVTQIYIEWIQKSVATPRLQLVAVTRTTTAPGQGNTLHFTVPADYLAVYHDNRWILMQCTIRVYAGDQQPNQRSVGSNVVIADVQMT